MKKLKLIALDLGAKEILSRDQLKNIVGGSGSDDGDDGSTGFTKCTVECDGSWKSVDCGDGVKCKTRGTEVSCGGGEYKDACV